MTEPELRETQLSSREIFDGRILHVFEDTVRLPNGAAASREYLRHIGAVCVIPVLEDGSVLVERQYRYPVAQVLTEIPAGKLDTKDEDHLLAAQRELRAGDAPTAEELSARAEARMTERLLASHPGAELAGSRFSLEVTESGAFLATLRAELVETCGTEVPLDHNNTK